MWSNYVMKIISNFFNDIFYTLWKKPLSLTIVLIDPRQQVRNNLKSAIIVVLLIDA